MFGDHSEQLLHRMFEDSPMAQSREALDGRFLQVNAAMCRLLGYTRRELLSMDFQAITHPDDLAGNLGKWERLLAGKISEYSIEKRYRHKDGTWLPVMVFVSLVRNPDGSPAYGMIAVQDLIQRDLARRAQLESEAKSRFLATMSHELRTPLNSILGFSQLLISGEGRTDQAGRDRYLTNIHQAGQHLLEMINEILDLAKVQSGQLDVDLERIEVGPAMRDAVSQLSPQFESKGLRVEVEPPGRNTALRADRRRLHQVLLNLLSNAIKFTNPGGSVTLRSQARGDEVCIEVVDTGIGIPPDRLDFIFDEFTQVDSGLRRTQEGTGLGLTLSRSLVERMGGSLGVSSVLGEGSTFTISLPRAIRRRRAA